MASRINGEQEGLEFIKKSVTELEGMRQQEMELAETLQEVKYKSMSLEAERLTLKYGSGHPRVQRLQMKLRVSEQTVPAIKQDIARTANSKEMLADDHWKIEGRVFNQKLQPVADITVFLTDEKRNWLRELGSACTGADGYYSILLTPEMVKRMQQMPLYLAASDNNQKLLCQATEPVRAGANEIEYRDIYLGGKHCAPPPDKENIRDDIKDNIIKRDEEKEKAEADARAREEELKKRAEAEAIQKEAEAKRRREEEMQKDADAKRREEELKKRTDAEAEARRREEEKRRQAEEELKRREEEKQKEADKKKEETNKERDRIKPSPFIKKDDLEGRVRKQPSKLQTRKDTPAKAAAPKKGAPKKKE